MNFNQYMTAIGITNCPSCTGLLSLQNLGRNHKKLRCTHGCKGYFHIQNTYDGWTVVYETGITHEQGS